MLETMNLRFLHLSPGQSPWLSPGRADKLPVFLQPPTLTSLVVIQQLQPLFVLGFWYLHCGWGGREPAPCAIAGMLRGRGGYRRGECASHGQSLE